MRRDVVITSLRVAIIVGTILAFINCGDRIFSLTLTRKEIVKICLTYLVPYFVSSYSSVKIILDNYRED
jgi:hypothetical protein